MRLLALTLVLPALACAGPRPAAAHDSAVWNFLRTRYDADQDGRVTQAEYSRSERGFRNLDASGDGVLSPLDFDPRFDTLLRGPWKSFEEFQYGEGGPEVGDVAPPVRLTSIAGQVVDLEALRGERPIALVFGSLT